MIALPPIEHIIHEAERALAEDLGSGDITAKLLPAGQSAQAELISRQTAVLSGAAWFNAVFWCLDPKMQLDWQVQDGERVNADQVICRLQGGLRELLTGERTALNLLQTLSGTATRARAYADAVSGLPTRILDTRKTLPGLRLAQKYAVRCGGCHNHRLGLYDAILIKENHILAAGSIANAVAAARDLTPTLGIEIEVETLEELREALAAGVERVLLDNFTVDLLREAVAINQGRARLEASGGMTLDQLRTVAETGVDDISIGDLTKSVAAVDLSLRLVKNTT